MTTTLLAQKTGNELLQRSPRSDDEHAVNLALTRKIMRQLNKTQAGFMKQRQARYNGMETSQSASILANDFFSKGRNKNMQTTAYGRTYQNFNIQLESDRNLIMPFSTLSAA